MTWWRREDEYRRRRVDDGISTSAVASQLEAHMVQCRLDKEEIRAQLSNQAADRKAMHEENQLRFGKLERIIYIAMGVGATAATLGSHINLSRIFSP